MKTISFCAPVLALILLACGGGGGAPAAATPGTAASDPAALNKAKCASCHGVFEPGQHTKAELEPIMKKHADEKRAALSDAEWAQLTDYLAKK